MDVGTFTDRVEDFIRSDWKTSELSRYYRSPNKLYSPTIILPIMHSQLAPLAFNEPEMAGYAYLLHYKGQLVYPEGGRFRFWGMGDNFMVVRVNGRVVLDAGAGWGNNFASAWDGKESKESTYHMGFYTAWIGDWIDLEAGIPLEMEVLIGEFDGGFFGAMLVVEQEGMEYPRNSDNGPMLPIFKTAELTRDQVEAIYEYLPEDRYAVTNGPVFCDYMVSKSEPSVKMKEVTVFEEPPTVKEPESKMRQWTLVGGKIIDAEFVMKFGNEVVLKTVNGNRSGSRSASCPQRTSTI